MAAKGEELDLVNKKKKISINPGKCDFKTLYDQITGDNPILITNRMFWTRKGNSKKYTCTLCNIGVQVSSNLSVFKSAVLAHVENKYHRKRYDSFITKETVFPSDTLETDDSETVSEPVMEDEVSILDILNQEEEELISGIQEFEMEENDACNNSLVDFNLIYKSFEKSNPVVKSSKQFIIKTENGRDFYCTLCKVLILNSLNATEFRYNLWVHLNDERHRERLPNYSEIKVEFEKVLKNLMKNLPEWYTYDLKFFEMGPVFRFIKCTICDMAVSTNLHRLENHIKDKDHVKKKHLTMIKQSWETEPLNVRNRNAFRKLVVQLEDRFKKDVKYIQIGKIPGYVICSLCTYVILPTRFYVQSHLESAIHAENKTTNLVSRNSKFKISLRDLLKTLPTDLRDYDIFEETSFGLRCKRCDETIPPTSYDLYSHINKERLSCVST